MKKLIFAAIFIFSSIPYMTTAQVFMTTSSNGTQQNTFYSNQTIYVYASNITNGSASVNIYLTNHNASLANQTVISSGSPVGPITITTNATGGIPVTAIWSPNTVPGYYDLIADVNKNNIYDAGTCGSGGDCLYTAGGGGVVVIRTPIPILTFSVGPYSPPNHGFSYGSAITDTPMLQIKIVGDQVEPVKITTFDFSASGTGDDKNGISVVKLFEDSNGNGIHDQGEPLLAYGQYLSAGGVLRMDLSSSPYIIQPNSTVYLLVQYTMTSDISSGQTFSSQLISITGVGQSTQNKPVTTGLPLTTATLTITGAPTTTTISNTSTTTTQVTTTVLKDQCTKDSDCGSPSCSGGKQTTPVCKLDSQKGTKACSSSSTSVGCCPGDNCGFDFTYVYYLLIVVVIAFLVPVIYFFFIRKPKPQPELYAGTSP